MCGIAGIITGKEQVARAALGAMVAAERHRGPDDSGESYLPLSGSVVGLGHRRLSILDLSSAGHQPMIHPGTGDQIVFNGEIYNYQVLRDELLAAGVQFTGHSDTEVLLHALSRWGPACLARLQGMYAFAYYNAREQTLLLARDSIGIKPLYVARVAGGFLFASEVRAMLASGLIERKLDDCAMAGLLAYGAVQEPYTIVKAIRAFPAGCYQLLRAGDDQRSEPVRFWNYPALRENGSPNAEDTLAAVRSTLEASVRDHLMADVPVGVFLSSGLDSTITAALAGKHSSQIRSFTVGFSDQPDLSEMDLAAETARQFGLHHTPIQVTGEDARAACTEWFQSLDQPTMDGMNVYLISKAVRAEGIKVALSGQGGDELFGGYASFADVPRLRRAMRQVAWVPAGLRAAACGLYPRQAVRQKLADIARSRGDLLNLYLHRRRAMSDGQLAQLGLNASDLGLAEGFMPHEAVDGLPLRDDDPVWSISQLECRFYLGNMLLRDGDVYSMAHGLEVRVPMLDQRMLDLMLPLPGRVRLPSGRANKHLLRTAFAPLLRPALTAQGKRGFTLPIRRWMLGPLRELCEQAMASLKSLGPLRPAGVDAVWQTFLREPETPIWSRAFTLCVLGHYVRRMGLTP